MKYYPIEIPTPNQFVDVRSPRNPHGQYAWIVKEVKSHFKRDQERLNDVVQAASIRLIKKEFIGRWFFKHLTDDLIEKTQVERMFGGLNPTFVGALTPVVGHRASPDSLWRVRDLLEFAHFDRERYYYSIQGHTIDSDDMLRFLGYPCSFCGQPGHKRIQCLMNKNKDNSPKGQYSVLQSMWRQGKIQPSELTDHDCIRVGRVGVKPEMCPACRAGLDSLRSRGLSLADDWSQQAAGAAKLRWNDKQLEPYLRGWRKSNFIKCVPERIMRPSIEPGIIAGLYAYAADIIDHEVTNEFKRMGRTDDLSTMVLNKGVSPGISDSETIAYESDESDETPQRVFRDTNSLSRFHDYENKKDLIAILERANLTDDEFDTIRTIDMEDTSVREYADRLGRPVQRVHRTRTAALRRLRAATSTEQDVKELVDQVCDQYDCTLVDIVGPALIGPAVRARADLFSELMDRGWTIGDIMVRFDLSEERVAAAINRRVLRDMRSATSR
jgi:DNA-directed RNA polymerase specialized sigma24 family protein